MKSLRSFFFIAIFFHFSNLYAVVSIGGFVLHPGTQKDVDGARNTFSFAPMIGFNTVLPAFWGQLFVPEVGLILNGSEADEYSKNTLFVLFDLGSNLADKIIFRYGLGWFLTKISGNGEIIVGDNGTGYAPNKSITSYNITWNAGLEYAHNNHYAVKLEGYLFQPLSSQQRHLSYSLSLNYYL